VRWEQQKFPCTPWATIVTFLIDSRKNVLWQLDYRGHLPLHNAILHELKIEIIQELLPPVETNDKHPDFERRVLLGAPGYTPLQVAVRRSADIAVYRLLLAHFHDPGYQTLTCRADNDETALMTAVRMGCCTEIIRLFIDRDENVLFLSNLLQLTPLHVALETGLSIGHVQMMMDKHKKVLKCRCNKQNTPLHTALLKRDIDVAVLDLLLAGNADCGENIQQCLEMKDAQGRTPYDIAVEQFTNWDDRGLYQEWWRIISLLEGRKN
jgi:ankyrin repeat protein